MRVKLL
nr:unnamed protein product [Callosobruchus analis]CAI5869057.1 unnamed protein product [Callosobruchus analis]